VTPIQLTSQNTADLCRLLPFFAVFCRQPLMIISMISQNRILIHVVADW